MSKNYIIVPISSQAVVVPEEELFNIADLKSRLNRLKVLGKDQLFDIDEIFNQDKSLEKGIHLHWNLPKLLRHGTLNIAGEMTFPRIPNRWMVVRLQIKENTNGEIPSKAWVIKSDKKRDEDYINNWIEIETTYTQNSANEMEEQHQLKYMNIGESVKLENYTNKQEDAVKLTAVCPTNPFFSAIYADCNNVLGFHDNLKDISTDAVTFSYVITGWYSENDILNSGSEELLSKIKQCWKVTSESDFNPSQSIYHSVIQNVQWDVNATNGIPTENIRMSVGNTGIEAQSAYIKDIHNGNTIENIEEKINALQYHLLEGKEPVDMEKVYQENHKKQFRPKKRGILWELKKIDSHNEEDKKLKQFPEDRKIATDLKILNNLQLLYNEQLVQLESKQQQYYLTWYKKALIDQDALGEDEIDNFDDIENALKTELPRLEAEINSAKEAIKQTKPKIEAKLGKIISYPIIKDKKTKKSTAQYELIQKEESRFWEPNDPSIMFFSDDIKIDHFNQELNSVLDCRTTDQILDSMSFELSKNGDKPKDSTASIHGETIFNINKISNANIPFDVINRLLYESLLLNIKLARYIAIKAYKDQYEGNEKGIESPIIINNAKNFIKPTQKSKFEKKLPFSILEHTQEWRPLFMAWKVSFTPKGTNNSIICNGMVPITNGVSKNINEFISESTAKKFNKALSQNLSGLNQQLVTLKPYLQFPPLEYCFDGDGDFFTGNHIDNSILKNIDNSAYKLACNPLSGGFSPLRNGVLKIEQLFLIDCFGRSKKIVPNTRITPLLANSLEKGSANNEIKLKKRIIQPARLDFNWINLNNEIVYQDCGTIDHPIIGWIIPNFLDHQLMIYNQDGEELKMISLKSTKEDFIPSKNEFKDNQLNVSSLIEERENKWNSIFKQLIKNLNANTLFNVAKNMHSQSMTKNTLSKLNNSITYLYGKSIVVARAKIKLELLGDSLKNHQYNASSTTKNISLEVSIGSCKKESDDKMIYKDGLLGFLIEEDLTKLYASGDSIKLDEGKEVTLILLLKAGTQFQLHTNGVLPTKTIDLFPHAIEELSKNINISFLLCPFIAAQNTPDIPVPNISEVDWNWVHKSGVKIWEKPTEVNNQSKKKETVNFSSNQFYEGWVKLNNFKSYK